MDLRGEVVAAASLRPADRDAMFALMTLVYDGATRDAFEADLANKDECIVLHTPQGTLAGFSTQRFITVPATPQPAQGVFSGDTVIHPEHWGSPALFQAFARRYVADEEPPHWWFLTSKGHRTYRMLSTFFDTYWPSRRAETPTAEQALIHAYAGALYPADYDPRTGVINHSTPKDRLRDGIAGVTQRDLRNPEVAFFVSRNPGHTRGDDLACLCRLSPHNLRERMRPVLLGS